MVQRLRCDLQTLPIYYAKSGDKVFLKYPMPPQLRHPDFVTRVPSGAALAPWGWAPELEGLFGADNVKVSTEEMSYWASRVRGVELWRLIYELSPDNFVYSPPIKIETTTEVDEGEWVIKEDYTSSGRGIEFIHAGQDPNLVIQKKLKGDKQFYIEPYYPIAMEVGLEYGWRNGTVDYIGYHTAITDQGKYVGSQLESIACEREVTAYAEIVRQALQKMSGLESYKGIIGVDTALYLHCNQMKFVPCLEINIRPTMGFVALCLKKRYLGGRAGRFMIYRMGDPSLSRLVCDTPLYLSDREQLSPGLYPLTPILTDTYFVATLEVYA